jgi:hypothetical protein
VGRSYNISGTGLNQYVLLLAETGAGKESIASGIDKLMSTILKTVPASAEFMGPAEISSSQALTKYMSKTSRSFVSLVGEFGLMLQQMSNANAPPHLLGLRRMLLDLYNKSGEGKVLRPTIYSSSEKNTVAINSPAFTMLGESTPERYYEILNESMITEGLLPRFTTIEYLGSRVDLNPNHMDAKPSFQLIEHLSTLCAHSLMLNSQNKSIQVQMSEDAKKMMDQFNEHCDDNIRSGKEIKKHLWNRAHIKALKLAAVVAVGCNPYDPIISVDNASWAIRLIVADVRNLSGKFEAGEIGIDNDESKQIVSVIKCIKEFISAPWSDVESYVKGMGHLHAEKVIPFAFIQRKLGATAVFRKDRQGATNALKRALKTLTERGDLQELSKPTTSTKYNTTALCFMISIPKVFGL